MGAENSRRRLLLHGGSVGNRNDNYN